MTEIRHEFAAVNGIRLHYAHAGRGAPILFLHGFPEFWYGWKHQLADFGRTHHAFAPDLRGYNLSHKPEGVAQYKPRVLVEDVRQFARQIGGGDLVVVAHDWGGALAWGLAISHPELIRTLVIVNSPHPFLFARDLAHDKAQQDASQYMNFFRSDKAERVLSENNHARLAAMMDTWGGAGGSAGAGNEDRDAYLAAWSQPGALTGGLNWYRASPLYPPIGDDPGAGALALRHEDFIVNVPTLVIWGMRDRALLPHLLEGLDELVPNLRIERLPDATHWVVHEQPERVNRLIREFIGSNS